VRPGGSPSGEDLLLGDLDGQVLAALATASGEHLPSAVAGATLTEAVLVLPLSIAWLVRTFHRPDLLKRERSTRSRVRNGRQT